MGAEIASWAWILRAVKNRLDPAGIMNPGTLVDAGVGAGGSGAEVLPVLPSVKVQAGR